MSVPTLWRNKKQRYSLRGSVCSDCENVIFPPRGVCPHCAADRTHAAGEGVQRASASESAPHRVTFVMPVAAEAAALAAGDD